MNSALLNEKIKLIVNSIIARSNRIIQYYVNKEYLDDTYSFNLEEIKFGVIEVDNQIKAFTKHYQLNTEDTKLICKELQKRLVDIRAEYISSITKSVENEKNHFLPESEEVIQQFDSIIEYLKHELNPETKLSEANNDSDINLNEHYIQWNNDIKELSYLFFKLKEEGIIKSDTLGMALSQTFIDANGEKVLNTNFNSNFSKFSKSEYPKNAIHIDKLVKAIKKPK